MYKIFKFGGASIKDVDNIINVGNILLSYQSDNLIIVFSAMGKVTNMLENVVELYIQKNKQVFSELQKVKDFHTEIINQLFEKCYQFLKS